ncbi:MAG: RHS repeat protein, partial [Endozoicomonadaceae bacterium]|nr:RHS repeat protein [Endozoicomonadaceae bacterium]
LDGLGYGWSWNLTHFNPVNNQLTTSQGQSFILQQDNMGHWWPRYHKIRDMQITGNKKTHFTITYINGLREILDHDGYEIHLEQQDGKKVKFSYISGTHLLSMISDDLGHKITLIRKHNSLTVTSYNSDGKPVNIYINNDDNQLHSITLSGDEHQDKQGIYMHYSPVNHLLNQFIYPTGLTKSIHYNCYLAMKMPLFYSNQKRALCVVTSQVVDPGSAQPEMVTQYSYDQTNNNDHNYLGFNSGLDVMPGAQKDILFEAPAAYTYQTSEDNGLSKIVRTYNKYHLLIDTKLYNNKTEHLLAETHNFFCRTDQYDGCVHTRFEELPVTYTLPLKIETYTWGDSSGYPAIDITQQSYDNNGRIISKTDAYGRRKTIKYCPVHGNTFCPAEPAEWSLNTLAESVTYYPSDTVPSTLILPIKTVSNFYQKEPNINGQGYILVLNKQVSTFGHQSNITTRQYYHNKDDYATYGLLKTLVLTNGVKSGQKQDKLTREYHYIINTNKETRTFYSILKNDNSEQRSSAVTVSLFTHQKLQITDASGQNITRYHYDNQGRLIQIDTAVDTDFAVSKYYHYTVSPELNQVIVTNPNNLQQKIIFDGAGRKLKNFSEIINSLGKAKHNQWQLINSTTYDANGRIAATYSYDYKNSLNQPKQLKTTYDYTVTGRILRKNLPDGEIIAKRYDDPDRCVVSYNLDKKGDHSAISVAKGNILDKPVKQILLPESIDLPLYAKQYCTTTNQFTEAKITTVTYDGYGRKTSSTDPEGKKVTLYYNDRGLVSKMIDPVGDRIYNTYNLTGKIIKKWIEPVKDNHQYLLFSAQYNAAGEPIWQAGEDGKRTLFTYTSDG